jgi:hypothetical protein
MNESEEKVALTFQPELTFTIGKNALQDFFDVLADKIAEKVVEKVVMFNLNDIAHQEEPAAGSAADPLKDDPNEPWGDEPETEEGADE